MKTLRFPCRIAIATSSDAKRILMTAPGTAPGQIVQALAAAARRNEVDTLLVCRGGGSLEDLWAFNERAVAEAVFNCAIPVVAAIGHETDTTIAELIAESFEDGQADVVTLFYSQFKSVIQQVPTGKQLIPAVVEGDAAPIDLNGAVYEYEPSEEEILETLLPRNLTTQILAALYENQAGFFGSQMAAMDNATRNAGDLINALTLQYNRKRQAQITTELIEIIAGAEAL